jgi:uncharacterized protein
LSSDAVYLVRPRADACGAVALTDGVDAPAETGAGAAVSAPSDQHLVLARAPRRYQVRRTLLAALAIAVLVSVIVIERHTLAESLRAVCHTELMPFDPPPATACWQHRVARSGFEVAYFQARRDGWHIDGTTTLVEDTATWVVTYSIRLDAAWATRSARITARTTSGPGETVLESDGEGRWRVDGHHAPHLEGCLDVDLESSAMTNALPVHRLGLAVGDRADAPAAYVRALDLSVGRLEQTYARIADEALHQRYRYHAPAFNFTCSLVYDGCGLVLDYPGIAIRAH